MSMYNVKRSNTNLFMKGNDFMKKRIIIKMLSAVSSVIMVSAMAVSSITASAATTPNSGGEGEDAAKVLHTVSQTSDLTFNINKDIVLFNEDALTIFEPNVTYTYTVAPATVADGTTITGLTPFCSEPIPSPKSARNTSPLLILTTVITPKANFKYVKRRFYLNKAK